MDKNGRKKKVRSEMSEVTKAISMILQIGISMMVPVFLCLFAGYKLDEKLGTSYLVIIFIILGILAGFKSVYTITKGFYEKNSEEEKQNQQYFADLYAERDRRMRGTIDPDDMDDTDDTDVRE